MASAGKGRSNVGHGLRLRHGFRRRHGLRRSWAVGCGDRVGCRGPVAWRDPMGMDSGDIVGCGNPMGCGDQVQCTAEIPRPVPCHGLRRPRGPLGLRRSLGLRLCHCCGDPMDCGNTVGGGDSMVCGYAIGCGDRPRAAAMSGADSIERRAAMPLPAAAIPMSCVNPCGLYRLPTTPTQPPSSPHTWPPHLAPDPHAGSQTPTCSKRKLEGPCIGPGAFKADKDPLWYVLLHGVGRKVAQTTWRADGKPAVCDTTGPLRARNNYASCSLGIPRSLAFTIGTTRTTPRFPPTAFEGDGGRSSWRRPCPPETP